LRKRSWPVGWSRGCQRRDCDFERGNGFRLRGFRLERLLRDGQRSVIITPVAIRKSIHRLRLYYRKQMSGDESGSENKNGDCQYWQSPFYSAVAGCLYLPTTLAGSLGVSHCAIKKPRKPLIVELCRLPASGPRFIGSINAYLIHGLCQPPRRSPCLVKFSGVDHQIEYHVVHPMEFYNIPRQKLCGLYHSLSQLLRLARTGSSFPSSRV